MRSNSVSPANRSRSWRVSRVFDESENDVLAFMTFPRAHWSQIYSTNPLERLNAEIKRRTAAVLDGRFATVTSVERAFETTPAN